MAAEAATQSQGVSYKHDNAGKGRTYCCYFWRFSITVQTYGHYVHLFI